MAVLGEEEGAGEVAAQRGEEPAGVLPVHLLHAYPEAEGSPELDVLAGRLQRGGRLEHTQLAGVMEAPPGAVDGGEVVMEACAGHVQGAQDGGGRPRPLA